MAARTSTAANSAPTAIKCTAIGDSRPPTSADVVHESDVVVADVPQSSLVVVVVVEELT